MFPRRAHEGVAAQHEGPTVSIEIPKQMRADAQVRLQQRVADLEGELYEEPFQYWHNAKAKKSK